jgi:two-component system NtrC family sensor kinase
MTASDLASRLAQVLVVEDSTTQALQIRHALEERGFTVDSAGSAEAAMDSLNQSLPDIIISDYHLPGMNGDGLARQVRANRRTRGIPILMLTGAHDRGLERQGLESGADAYIPKSADWDLIALRMKALLRRRRPGEPAGTTAPATDFRPAHIMLAHPRKAWAENFGEALEQEGYTVEFAGSPREAIARALSLGNKLDCIIADALTEEGGELCRQLNQVRLIALPGQASSPFQIVSVGGDAAAEKTRLAQAFAAGVDDIMPGDIDLDSLLVRIRTVVRRKLLQDEDRRIEAELRERDLAMERAQAEASAAQTRAALADELAETNRKLKDAQSKLVQAAKMASLGELVAGIAHEINNPLAFILAHQNTVERLLSDIGEKAADAQEQVKLRKAAERLGSMRLGLKRIQDLVLNLRKFSRLDEGSLQTMDVHESIESVIALLNHKLADRIEIIRSFRAERHLLCSPALLNQAVMNIIGNAADAIPGGGFIRISTENTADSYLIGIEDNGPGIPEDLRDRIFEPFFTTKPVGSGTGLGLAIAYSVVEAHGGQINVGRSPEGGASFRISIPLQAQS